MTELTVNEIRVIISVLGQVQLPIASEQAQALLALIEKCKIIIIEKSAPPPDVKEG